MSQFELDPTSNSDAETFKQSLRVFSSIVLSRNSDVAKGVIENIKIPALKSIITNEFAGGFLE